ncbi:hypothetical protein [Leifsonia sp. NPDC080035]|uniref:DUF1622 domain-containing protein n=1 Tax=Leifsonia sp. NPDC080035 TaxID=3143936 RepID=A0AAU7G9P7_9MICO
MDLSPETCTAIAAAVPALLIAILFERVRKMKHPFLSPETRREELLLSVLRSFGVLVVALVAIIVEGVAVVTAGNGLSGGAGFVEFVAFLALLIFVASRWAFASRGFADLGSLVRGSKWYRAAAQRLLDWSRTPELVKRGLREDLDTQVPSEAPEGD